VRRVPTPGRPEPPVPEDGGPPRGGHRARVSGLVRLVHPFPSLLDAAAAGALALLAGGSLATASVLALSMLAVQFAIGTVNDLADAPWDSVGRPRKPVPAGSVTRREARIVAVAAGSVGLALAATRGPVTLAIAVLGLGVGLAYDLALKPTPLSWLPYAVGIPLVPLFAWTGAAGSVPPAVLALSLLAVPAGAAIAVANALADLEDDRRAGARTVATALGAERAWRAAAVLLGATYLAAVAVLVAIGAGPGGTGAGGGGAGDLAMTAGWAAIAAAAVLLVLGAWMGRGPAASRRRAGWGIQAVGVVSLGCGWVVVLLGAGRLAGA
jgi:4-hydroxybenzoate polyprenyltransferase